MTKYLQFENGRLVKIDGMRPEYMDGCALIRLVRQLSSELAQTKHHVREFAGTFDEWRDMPSPSTKTRLVRSRDAAVAFVQKSNFHETY